MPKAINGAVVTHNMTIFQDVNNGTCACRMVLPLDKRLYKDLCVNAYWDKAYTIEGNGRAATKEQHKKISFFIKHSWNTPITYSTDTQALDENPFTMYVIPYDSYVTFQTDNLYDIWLDQMR
jgi:hypothetical protein